MDDTRYHPSSICRSAQQFFKRRDRAAIDPTGNNMAKVTELRFQVHRKAMRGNPPADMNTDSCYLSFIDPYACQTRFAFRLQAKISGCADQNLFQRPHIPHYIFADQAEI